MAVQLGDILLDNDSVMLFKDGDLVLGDAPGQQTGAILNANSGNFRRWPTLAANVDKRLDGPNNSRDIVSDVQTALSLDGWSVSDLDIGGDKDEVEITIREVEKLTDNTESLV